MPNEVCLFTVTSAVVVRLKNGLEAVAHVLKTRDLRRDDDTYTATVDQVFNIDHWADVEDRYQITIPINNIAGYSWVKADAPIANGSADIQKLRALLEKDV